jgi:hypothetical protein
MWGGERKIDVLSSPVHGENPMRRGEEMKVYARSER